MTTEKTGAQNRRTDEKVRPDYDDDDLLTNAEAAEYLDVSGGTLEVWRCTRRYPIPYIKVGRKVRYRKKCLDKFLNDRTVERQLVTGLSCPSQSAITLMSTPACSRCIAVVWRIVCGETRLFARLG
jgi:excisionase family DNA binding protein